MSTPLSEISVDEFERSMKNMIAGIESDLMDFRAEKSTINEIKSTSHIIFKEMEKMEKLNKEESASRLLVITNRTQRKKV